MNAPCPSCIAVALVLAAGSSAAPSLDPAAAIRRAGNVEDEAERLRILRDLRAAPALDPQLATDLDRMIAFIERWKSDPSLYRWFDREVRQTTDYEFSIAEGSPLAPLASFYRGRMLVWITNEYGNLISYHEERRRFLDRAVREFRIAAAAFPENRVIRYTSEVRFTDRVLTFPRLFGDDMMFPEAVPAASGRPQPDLLYATATGDRGSFRVFPLNAVRWLTPPRDIAALVTRAGRDACVAELYHFGEGPRPMGAEFYLLAPGEYAFTLTGADGAAIAPPTIFSATGPRTRIRFELPARRHCVLGVNANSPTKRPTPTAPAHPTE